MVKPKQKINNAFKVNHVRNFKMKQKPKPVKTVLKKLQYVAREKVVNADEELKSIQDKLLLAKPAKGAPSQVLNKSDAKERHEKALKEFQEVAKSESEVLDKLDSMNV